MILKRIAETLRRLKETHTHLPQSSMGLAIAYTLNLWPELQVFLEDGRVGIDNNPVENAIRPTAIGKKNWLFIGEAEAGDRYWPLFAQAARSGCFDIMAHPDLIKKFGHRPPGDLRRYYEPAIQACLDANVAIEINTAGLFKPVAECYPAPDFLRLAAAADLPLTINSDAHAPEEVGRAFPQALALAADSGFTHLARFQARQRRLVPLD